MAENECFICCSKSGKTTHEKLLDNVYHKRLRYPLISLSYAYECNCKTMWAHNRCLIGITKCPTCRKNINKPRLCVRGNIENFLYLGWIRKNPTKFKKIEYISVLIMFIIFVLNYLNEQKYIVITNNYILLSFISISLMCSVILYIGDYIEKYWLYNNKSNIFY